MKLLLTNDDGVASPGILSLARAFGEQGHQVTVVAPDGERSAFSHAISWGRPITAKAVEMAGFTAYGCSGTPADCTRIGLGVFCAEADFVISGINAGSNMGKDVFYSGTLSAAHEAVMQGVPALAVSQDWGRNMDYQAAATWAVRMLNHLREHPMRQDTVCSLNVPNLPLEEIKGIKLAELNEDTIRTGFDCYKGGGGDWYFAYARVPSQPAENSDRALLKKGYATVTYLGWTLAGIAPDMPLPEIEGR